MKIDATLNEFDILHPEIGGSIDVESIEQQMHRAVEAADEPAQRWLKHAQRVLRIINDPAYAELEGKLGEAFQAVRRKELADPMKEVSFEELKGDLSEEQFKVYAQTLGILQISKGCSVACPNCAANALIKPRAILSFDCIREWVRRFGEVMKQNEIFLYYASDPIDWEDSEGRNYADVQAMFLEELDWCPYVSSAIPIGREEVFKRTWQESNKSVRLSLSSVNRKRLKKYLQTKQAGEYQEEMGLEWNLMHWLGKPQKTDTSYIAVNDDASQTKYQWKDYEEGKVCEEVNGDLGLPLGKSYDYRSLYKDITCKDGGLVTPDGLYTMTSVMGAPRSPDGMLLSKVTSKTETIFPYSYSLNHLGIEPIRPIDLATGEERDLEISDVKIYQFLCWLASTQESARVAYGIMMSPSLLNVTEEECVWMLERINEFLSCQEGVRSEILRCIAEDETEAKSIISRSILQPFACIDKIRNIAHVVLWAKARLSVPENEYTQQAFRDKSFFEGPVKVGLYQSV